MTGRLLGSGMLVLLLLCWGWGCGARTPLETEEAAVALAASRRCSDDEPHVVPSKTQPLLLWQRSFPSAPVNVVTDDRGAIYVSMYATAGDDFGNGVSLPRDAFATLSVLKLDPDGHSIWVLDIPDAPALKDGSRVVGSVGLATDGTSVYAAVIYSETGFAIHKISPDGKIVWTFTQAVPGISSFHSTMLAADALGNVYMSVSDTRVWNVSDSISSIVAIDTDKRFLWREEMRGPRWPPRLAAWPSRRGGGVLAWGAATSDGAGCAKYATDTTTMFAPNGTPKPFSVCASDYTQAMMTDRCGVYAVARDPFNSSWHFTSYGFDSTTTFHLTLPGSGSYHGAKIIAGPGGPLLIRDEAVTTTLTRFGRDGSLAWSKELSIGGSTPSWTMAHIDPQGAVVIAGQAANGIDFGAGSTTERARLSRYVVKLAP